MKSTQSIWLETARLPHYSPLRGEVRVDVAIVGAGITGLTAAWLLKCAGKTVAVIDKGQIANGESGFTTAHITQMLDISYHDLIGRFGLDKARQIANSKRVAINKIADIAHELNIPCHWELVPGYRYAETAAQATELQNESIALKMLDISGGLDKNVPLPFASAVLRVDNQAQFHPVIYLSEIAEKIPGNGSFIFENSFVSVFEDKKLCRITTAQGSITATDVILATNVPISNRFFIQTKLAAYRSYAVAAVVEKLPPKGLFWDMQDPYHYIRTGKINYRGQPRDFLIVGGEDHKTGEKKDTAECFQRLENFTFEHFGAADFPFRWSGQIIESVDGLPYIGKNAFSNHFYIATGFSGNGITFGSLAGMIISDSILGRPNPFEKIYAPSRVMLSAAKEYMHENKDFPAHFVCDYLSHHENDINQVPKGEGRLIGQGTASKAVYCDQNGTIHAFSAICPHLGCLVNWNPAEKSWDCPCHGSRFNCKGQVINGPAHNNLKRVDAAAKVQAV